jgi:hypothetical protein
MTPNSIAQSQAETREESEMAKALLDQSRTYYEGRNRSVIAEERATAMKGQGVFMPTHWLDILDGNAAIYLAHFAHYEGTQSREDGFISDSDEAIREKLGKRFTPKVLWRVRKDLQRLGLAEVRPGTHRVTMVRPNVELLKAWQEYGDYDEAVMALLEGRFSWGQETPEGNHHDSQRSSLNTVTLSNSTETLSNSPPERVETAHENPTVERCLSVLREMKTDQKNWESVVAILPDLLKQHPVLTNPVDTCRKYLDKIAWRKAENQPPIRFHAKYLTGHFQQEAAEVEAQPRNRHGAGTEFFRAADLDQAERPQERVWENAQEKAEQDPDSWQAEYMRLMKRVKTPDKPSGPPPEDPSPEAGEGTVQPTLAAVRGLLESGGAFHDYAVTVIEEGCPEDWLVALIRHVAKKLEATPEDCREHVFVVVRELAKQHEKEEVA